MREIFYELITEASKGKVVIDDDEWEIAFNTSIPQRDKHYYSEKNLAELVIKDEDSFFELLEEYINLELEMKRKIPNFLDKNRSSIKWIMSYLFVNATTEDFLNPEDLIRRRINYLKDNTFKYLENGVEIEITSLQNSNLKIKNSSAPVTMETPYMLELSLNNIINSEKVSYNLPTIYYGISNGICYIYAVKMPEFKKETSPNEDKYIKRIKRLLYKLNAGVPEKEKLLEEEENITDVTPSFVLALNIFMTLLKNESITKVKVVPYLPVRYTSRMLMAEEKNSEEDQLRNDLIQENLTEKLIRTFRRLSYHDKGLQIETFPYEIDEYLTISLSPVEEKTANQILDDTTDSIGKRRNGK